MTQSPGGFQQKNTRDFESGRLLMLAELFVQLLTLFRKLGGIQRDTLQDFQQCIDLTFGGKELIHDDDLLILQHAITRLEITLLVAQGVIRLRYHFFHLQQKLRGILDHSG